MSDNRVFYAMILGVFVLLAVFGSMIVDVCNTVERQNSEMIECISKDGVYIKSWREDYCVSKIILLERQKRKLYTSENTNEVEEKY